MSPDDEILRRVCDIQRTIMHRSEDQTGDDGLDRLNRFMLALQGVGVVEGRTTGGATERYLLIDKASWEAACRILKPQVVLNLLAWQESDLVAFLESWLQMSCGRTIVPNENGTDL